MSGQNPSIQIQLLTGAEVAQILRISRAYAYRLVKNGTIPTIKLGRSVRVNYENLLEFIRENNKHGNIT